MYPLQSYLDCYFQCWKRSWVCFTNQENKDILVREFLSIAVFWVAEQPSQEIQAEIACRSPLTPTSSLDTWNDDTGDGCVINSATVSPYRTQRNVLLQLTQFITNTDNTHMKRTFLLLTVLCSLAKGLEKAPCSVKSLRDISRKIIRCCSTSNGTLTTMWLIWQRSGNMNTSDGVWTEIRNVFLLRSACKESVI